MFSKPFRIKTQTTTKGSDRKKLRSVVSQQFADLTNEDISTVIPQKDPMATIKLCSYAGDNIIVYTAGDNPVYFEHDRRLYPTVYTLWKFPDLLPRITTWPAVFKPLTAGADLMLPGVITSSDVIPSTFRHINKGTACSVNLAGNKAPIAVTTALMSGDDMYSSAMKGKGYGVVHILGDELWKLGDKSNPPEIPDDETENDADKPCDTRVPATTPAVDDGAGEITEATSHVTLEDNDLSNDIQASNSQEDIDRASSPTDSTDTNGTGQNESGDGEAASSMSPEELEDLLIFCFKCAIKSRIKKNDLPILTSTFFKKHMVPYSQGKMLDIKKTRFKKLSKFLSEMEKEQYIKVKELSKGSHSIVEADRSHRGLRGLDIPDIIEGDDELGATNVYHPPVITEMFSITGAVLPIVKPSGLTKGTAVTVADFRRIVTDYVNANCSQDENHRGFVRLDPHLADCALTRSEGDVPFLRWDDLFNRLLNKLQLVTKVEFEGHRPVIRKGKMDCITLEVKQRASNKKVTLIERLDLFGISPEEFAHKVQVAVACSTSVTPLSQKNAGMQVMVQGNQIGYVADLLINDYKIPKKYIQGLDKMPKNKKR